MAKTKEQIAAEVPSGGQRLTRQTKVVATKIGYYDGIREIGDVFYVREGTIMESDCWFEIVDAITATNEDSDKVNEMDAKEIKVELARRKINFANNAPKADLVALLVKARSEDSDLA